MRKTIIHSPAVVAAGARLSTLERRHPCSRKTTLPLRVSLDAQSQRRESSACWGKFSTTAASNGTERWGLLSVYLSGVFCRLKSMAVMIVQKN